MSDGYVYEKDVPTMKTADGLVIWPVSLSELKKARDSGFIKYIVGTKSRCFYKAEWLDEYVKTKAKQEVKLCEDNGSTRITGLTTTSPEVLDITSIGMNAIETVEREKSAASLLKQRILEKRKTD